MNKLCGRNSYMGGTLLLSLMLVACTGADWPPAERLTPPSKDDVGILPSSVSASPAEHGMWNVTFRYAPEDTPDRVNLAGSFNAWNQYNREMQKVAGENAWEVTILAGPGQYQYKFVRNGGQWIADPANPETLADNHGGENSVLRIGKLASLRESNGKAGDKQVAVVGLQHDPKLARYAQPLSKKQVLLRYRTLSHDIERVQIALRDGTFHDLHVEFEDRLFAHWQAIVPLQAGAKPLQYTFVLHDGGRRFADPQDYEFGYKAEDMFTTPEWARHAIWYQIMPDRFRNGDPDSDPDPLRPWTSHWFDKSPWEGTDGQTFYEWFVFSRLYGGDLAGMEERLDYLRELGVNALYLNPIFQAEGHHKYNATNYLHIDYHFGGGTRAEYEQAVAKEDLDDPATWQWTTADRRFLAFLKTAKSKGFRVIIDGVFNHVGTRHPAFLDVKANGRSSQYADWFAVTSWDPFEYEGWAGHDQLPVFAKTADGLASQKLKQHIFNVTRRWMDPDGDGDPSDGIDGWRLDVPNEVPAPFWAEWRAVVKEANPEAYITGEIWDRADQWLNGDHFDAVMNYQFAKPPIRWIIDREQKITPTQLDHALAELRMAYPAEATYVMQNLVDSHDTDRIASMAFNPDRDYDGANRLQDNGPDYNGERPDALAYARARLVALLQMTYVGAPMIYYGTEVGMFGADDPTCRKPMLWKDLEPYDKSEEDFVMADHFKWFQRIIAVRNEHLALRTGDFQTLLADDREDTFVFARHLEGDAVVVALNASLDDKLVEVPMPPGAPKSWQVIFSGGGPEMSYDGEDLKFTILNGKLKIRVPGLGGTLLEAK